MFSGWLDLVYDKRIKNRIGILAEKFMINKVPKKPWIHLVDFVTKLLLVVEKNVILVIYSRLSKIVYFVTITKKTLVEDLVRDNI